MCQEHRSRDRVLEDVARHPTHEHFPQSAMGIGTHDQQASVALLRHCKQRIANRSQVGGYHTRGCRNAMAVQVGYDFGLRGAASIGLPVDAHNLHRLGKAQKRYGGRHRMPTFRTLIPRNHRSAAPAALELRWRQQHWPALLQQRLLRDRAERIRYGSARGDYEIEGGSARRGNLYVCTLGLTPRCCWQGTRVFVCGTERNAAGRTGPCETPPRVLRTPLPLFGDPVFFGRGRHPGVADAPTYSRSVDRWGTWVVLDDEQGLEMSLHGLGRR